MKRRVQLREPVGVAVETLLAHKLRSFLMLLGIILSVATLIVVIALISGVNQYIANKVANLGSNAFTVMRFPIITEMEELVKATRRNKIITWEDYESLRDNLKLPAHVGAEIWTTGKARAGALSVDDTSIRGVTASMEDIDPKDPTDGRYITEADENSRGMVTMLGAELANKLFPNVDPLGHEVNLDGRPFVVIGVAKAVGTVLGRSQDNFAYIPIETYIKIYAAHDGIWINVQARGPEWMERTQDETRVLMRARRHLRPDETDSFGIIDSATLMDLWKQLTGVIAIAMVGVVSVFLVIGGVVIMNVMLATVTERTREIGIRKALGASRGDILLQFLIEACVMSAVGGAIGVLAAYAVSGLAKATTSIPMNVPLPAVIAAELVSAIVGIFFGVYPARKAAMLEPIEALRTEI
jgi:putative ABC transport system permease protein